MAARFLKSDWSYYSLFGNNSTNTTDWDSQLVAPQDVPVDSVLTSIYLNSIICVVVLGLYEILRRLLPTVYSSKERLDRTGTQRREHHPHSQQTPAKGYSTYHDTSHNQHNNNHHHASDNDNNDLLQESLTSLPNDRPLDWVFPVFAIPWSKVRRIAGLDGYFFLRYIRMNVRITAVSTFWFFAILVPVYMTGSNPYEQQQGWYLMSAANIPSAGWRIWIAILFAYLFAGFIFFVVKQEYRHFLEVRQDFLARGAQHVDPQHHFSIMVERIPYELRSDRALKDYFDKLFPGKVHSASVVMKLPDLEEASQRCVRTVRRLEKSIAYLYATGKRPTHIVGRGRLNVLGVDLQPIDWSCICAPDPPIYVQDGRYVERPERGTRVDSISYYTQELAAHSRELYKMQQRKAQIAESGNIAIKADNWMEKAFRNFSWVQNIIMADSALANDLLAPEDPYSQSSPVTQSPRAELMTSRYGAISPSTLESATSYESMDDGPITLVKQDSQLEEPEFTSPYGKYKEDDERSTFCRRWAGRMGLDFVVSGIHLMNKQIDVALEGVIGATMSSTGFVTFHDLSSTTIAASAPLSVKTSVLSVRVAPEPRDIRWQNADVSKTTQQRREQIVNFFLFLGVILWSFPLAAIQAFAKAKYLVQVPGLEWIDTIHGGEFSQFVNGYLPVVALLALIMILPVIFEYVAVNFEHRKTYSDIQASMLGRYFYYQLANVYVSVTAGSIAKVLASLIDRPSSFLELLGQSLPQMAGYFIALLVTKTLAGLPMIFIRFGALGRMLFLKLLSNEKKLTQRELDAVYRLENVQYGWEFPTQLLVVVIVFTYAVICPIILPFGLIYFLGALTVYKKQVLYVYSPVFESGGAMFPTALQRTLFGLVCGQVTLFGYMITKGARFQLFALIPLIVTSICAMNYFERKYAAPSKLLSLERAREYDRLIVLEEEVHHGAADLTDLTGRRRKFDKDAYRQPVLTELATEPLSYRKGLQDPETQKVCDQLRRINFSQVNDENAAEPGFISPF
ncbi:hypothetical protein MPSEU_000206500 [Mayamaea pseudoterrestris]|nr:hypothetical protein MPSEU_000206500 [Mayamaea pseudoterrestris]